MSTKFRFITCYPIAFVIAFTFGCSSPEESPESTMNSFADTVKLIPIKTEIPVEDGKSIDNKKKSSSPLTVIVKNLASTTAPVVIGVYNSQKGFLYKEARLNEYTFIPNGDQLTAIITDLPYGVIAIGIYQDMNSNSAFDKNKLGLPKEGYAFSNNIRPRVKAPEFDECKFTYSETENTISIDLIK